MRDTENVAEWLVDRGFNVDRYFGGLDGDARIESERRLQNNEIKALVATTALGMGYDKPDLGFVVHFQAPGSAVAYYQQVGRAGRALDRSVAVLLRGVEDADIQDFFITQAFAAPDVADRVLAVFDACERTGVAQPRDGGDRHQARAARARRQATRRRRRAAPHQGAGRTSGRCSRGRTRPNASSR